MDALDSWLEDNGLGQYSKVFAENDIGFDTLSDLTTEDLAELGVSIGHRKKLFRAIAKLRRTDSSASLSGGESAGLNVSDAERRQLSILFCDLVGSTALSTQVDPEDTREIIRAYQQACERVIAQFDGYVARYSGDGILAYFGYPVSHENDAERSVRAGLGIVKAIGDLSDRLKTEFDCEFKVRVGIATGLVIIGDLIGEGSSQERDAVGETPNLAARLQGVAEPNAVVISPATKDLVGSLFDCQSFGFHELKGLAEPVEPWIVVSDKPVESRFKAARHEHLTKLAGRDKELQAITSAWDAATGGAGSAVVIVSDPGFGKSRLVEELDQRIEQDSPRRLVSQCWSHTQNSSMYPIAETIQRSLGISAEDDSDESIRKLEASLETMGLCKPEIVYLIAAMLGVEGLDPEQVSSMTPESQKQETFSALTEILKSVSTQGPLLYTFEDMHWADASTREFVAYLLPRIKDSRILILATLRAGFESRWPWQDDTERVELGPLADEDARIVINSMLGEKQLPDTLVDEILRRGDGIPLFIEELTRLLIVSLSDPDDQQQSSVIKNENIPQSLQDLLLARLNQLGSEKKIVVVGAVLGRQFDYSLILAVWKQDPAVLETGLQQLVERNILIERMSGGQKLYFFRHVLIQEAAYTLLLRSDRRQLHGLVAETMESSFPGTVKDRPELVAEHCRQAGQADQAISYFLLAGRQCKTRSANLEAVSHLTAAQGLLDDLPEGNSRLQTELDILVVLTNALVRTQGYASDDIEKALARARELCDILGTSPQTPPIVVGLSIFQLARGDIPLATELGKEVLALSEASGEPTLALLAHRAVGCAEFWQGDLRMARQHLEQAVELYQPDAHKALAEVFFVDPGVVSLSTLAMAVWSLGLPDTAISLAQQSVDIAEAGSHSFSRIYGIVYMASVHQMRGEHEIVLELAEKVIKISEKDRASQGVGWGYILSGWATARQNPSDESVMQISQSISTWQSFGAQLMVPYFFTMLSDVYRWNGQLEESERAVQDGLVVAEQTGQGSFQPELYRQRGELRLLQTPAGAPGRDESLSKAKSDFRLALEEAGKCGSKAFELRASVSLARVFLEQERKENARDVLKPQLDRWSEGMNLADIRNAQEVLALTE